MFGAGVLFLAVAVASALFGFGVVSDEAPLAGKLFSAFFFCAALAAFWWGWMMRSRQPAERRRGSEAPSRLAGRAL